MSRISDSGVAVAGVGDGVISLNGVVPVELQGTVGGGACWFDRDSIAYQRKVGPEQYIIEAFNASTLERWTLAKRGASVLRSDGQGRFATWAAGAGVIDEQGRTWAKAALLDYEDGILVLCPDQQTAVGIELCRGGQVIQTIKETGPILSDAVTGPAVFLRSGLLAYQNDQGWSVVGANTPYVRPGYPVAMVPVPLLDGRYAVLEHDAARLYLRWPEDPSKGLLIQDAGEFHAMDARVVASGAIVVAWWTGPGCLPGEFRSAVVSADDIGSDALAPTAVTPIAPNISTKLVAGAWGTTPETPGNLSLGPDPAKAVICTAGEVSQIDPSRLMALFVSEADAARDRQAAEDLRVPLAIYVDDRDYLARLPGILTAVGETPWIAILQCYIDCRGREAESLDRFAAEVFAQASRLPVPWIAAVRCTSPRVDGIVIIPVDRVIAAMNRLVPIVADSNCLGWALFKWKRGDGVTGVPELRPAAEAWLNGAPTLQPNQARTWAAEFYGPAAPPQEPSRFAITVHDFTEQGQAPFHPSARYTVEGVPPELGILVMLTLNGEIVGASDRPSGTVTSETPITEAGEYRLGLTASSMGRKTQTGATRIVRVLPAAPTPEIPGITYPTQPGSGTAEGARKPSQEAADAAQRENEGAS